MDLAHSTSLHDRSQLCTPTLTAFEGVFLHTDDHPWLPASPRERVFLFSLSLSLILNTTVVLLLVTGDLPVLADLRQGPAAALVERQNQPGSSLDADQVFEAPQPDEIAPVLTAATVTQAEISQTSANRLVDTAKTRSVVPALVAPESMQFFHDGESDVDESAQHKPPVTFFGVDVE